MTVKSRAKATIEKYTEKLNEMKEENQHLRDTLTAKEELLNDIKQVYMF